MLRGMYYTEYLLWCKHIQRSPWLWGLYLKDEDEEKGEQGEQGDEKAEAKAKPKKKKKLSRKKYDKMVRERVTDPRSGGSYE